MLLMALPNWLAFCMAARAGGAGNSQAGGNSLLMCTCYPVAEKLGFDRFIIADEQDGIKAIEGMTNGRGADLAVEGGSACAIAATV